MALTSCVVFVALFAGVATQENTPISKVITLMEDLKTEVETEGQKESSVYNKFACFCKDKTTEKSNDVIKGEENINVLSSDIGEKTQSRKEKMTEAKERKQKQEEMAKELDETHARCSKEAATYEAANADISKAISSLESAIKALNDSKPPAASLLEVKSAVDTLMNTGVTKTAPSAQKAIATMLLQAKVDPNDPEYGFHSTDIVELCEQLLTEFRKEKSTLDTEYDKTSKACEETIKSLDDEMKTNEEAINSLHEQIDKLAEEVAKHREDLVQADSDMKDDRQYLKDLTARCEERANDYDQRANMRDGEIKALSGALEVLTGKVKDSEEANKRALFIQTPKAPEAAKADTKAPASVTGARLSFLQSSSVKAHSFLAGRDSLELEAMKNKALDLLRSEGQRIGSVAIAALTTRVAADPFKKVKGLIQKLIERLLEESKQEATKKGFCDEAVGTAEKDRNYRFEEATDLAREISGLEAKEDELSTEIEKLGKETTSESEDLKKQTEDREEEKTENMNTIKMAKEGLDGVKDAITILKSFYSEAAKAAAFVQASPVDEDTSGPGFSGAYKGKQGGMKAVFGLLEVIQSDFDRTIRKTEECEKKAHRDFVDFTQTSKSSIAGKSTKKELDDQDLKTTRTNLERSMADLQSQQDLVDKAIEELEALKPQCIDTGMSYSERVAKREEEIAALKSALGLLAPP